MMRRARENTLKCTARRRSRSPYRLGGSKVRARSRATSSTNFSPQIASVVPAESGRDLFNLATALTKGADPERVLRSFLKYMEHEGHDITRAMFEENFALKMEDPDFLADVSPLLSADYTWAPSAEAPIVSSQLIERLPGDPWKGV